MILSIEEIQWVKDRMKIYVIKYQEIYDEILDHILTAIEERRNAGDDKDIQSLFQNVVDDHFNGYIGIEALAVSEEKIHQKAIRKMFFERVKHHFNWRTLIGTIILLAIAYKLPNVKAVHFLFMLFMLVMGASPVIYAYAVLAGKVKTIKGKSSLLKVHLISQTTAPILLLQGLLYIPNLFDEAHDRKDFYTFNNVPQIVLMCILIFLMIVNISYIQSCKEIIAKRLLR